MTTAIDLNSVMAKIQGLLAQADRTEFPEEAKTFRAHALKLMDKYRLDEENLIASDQASILPVTVRLWLGVSYDPNRQVKTYYQEWYALARHAAEHAGCMVTYRWGRNDTGQHGIFAVIVGYPGDVRLAEMVFTSARIVFGERLEPTPDPTLSDQVNAYRLRSAGINRDRAAEMLWGSTSAARAAAIGRLYKAECAERNETPALDGRGIDANLYRGQFAAAFVTMFARRLREARDAADSNGGAVVFAGREDRIREAFYTECPEMRPRPATDVATAERAPERKRRGREPKPYYETAAGRRAMDRHLSPTAEAARRAGIDAAREVELDRPTPAKRMERGTSGAIGE